MIDMDRVICGCNDLSVRDVAECAKRENLTTLDDLLENDVCPMGDKCESCQDEGFYNDGYNLSYVLSLVEKKLV